jgi:hypothetical protein
MNDDGLFSERRTSLATLGDKEFELAVRACLDHSTDDLVESIGRECPAWLENWVDSLEAEELYGVDSDEPPVSAFGLIWDRGTDECWTYLQSTDDLFRGEKINCGRSGLTPEGIWKLVQEDLDEAGDNVVYGSPRFNSALVPRSELEAFLRDALADAGFERMNAGMGLPLSDWMAAEYGDV